MAIMQYIGARYVPEFFKDGEGGWNWKPGTYYEPLTIVQYNNSSYTSRIPVPATIGNPVENPDYWAETGNMNGQISNLQRQINELSNDLSEIPVRQMIDYKNMKMLIIGDSYCQSDAGVGSVPTVPWCNRVKSTIESFGGTVDIVYQGGTGFTTSPSYLDLLGRAPGSDYNMVIVQGISNGMANSSVADIASAIDSFVGAVRESFGCVVNILPITHGWDSDISGVYGKLLQLVRDYPYNINLKCYTWPGGTDVYQVDKVHLLQTGQDNVYKAFMRWLNGIDYFRYSSSINGITSYLDGEYISFLFDGNALGVAGMSAGENKTLSPSSVSKFLYSVSSGTYGGCLIPVVDNGALKLLRLVCSRKSGWLITADVSIGQSIYALPCTISVPFSSTI